MSDSSKNNSPRGLLARAALYRDTRNLNRAHQDLQEVCRTERHAAAFDRLSSRDGAAADC